MVKVRHWRRTLREQKNGVGRAFGMDPILPRLERETRRRRRAPMFRHQRVPVRMLVPNFFTLLALCAGLTSIRMSIEGRYELALGAIVFAALLDGIDGRVARLLKASSRFGAELDSLADFVNFGVAPAFLIFTWGLGDLKSLGWICVMIFALASALRLARFNVALDEDKPKWQSAYFSGMPTPAAAIVVLLPVYIEHLGFVAVRTSPLMLDVVLVYTLLIAFMMVSTHPDVLRKAARRAHFARVRAAAVHAGDRLRRAADHLSVRDADGRLPRLSGDHSDKLAPLRADAGCHAPGAGEEPESAPRRVVAIRSGEPPSR